MFGFPADEWKTWQFNGLEVLVPKDFNTTVDAEGNTLIYPEGDMTVPPSGRMPRGGYFFDCIVRQEPFDEEKLNPEDNMEEFGPISQEDLDHIARTTQRAAATGRGVIATFGGTAFGDIALVPGPFLKHPKGIRDVAEWYVSTSSRQDYIHKVFEHQCEIAIKNLETHPRRDRRQRAGGVYLRNGFWHADFCILFREHLPQPVLSLLQTDQRLDSFAHAVEDLQAFLRCGLKFLPSFIEAGIDILNPVQCSATGMDPEQLKANFGDRLVFWGGGVDTQRVLPFGTPAEVREQVLRRCRDLRAGRWIRFQHHSQRTGGDSRREYCRHARCRARIQWKEMRQIGLQERTGGRLPHDGQCIC